MSWLEQILCVFDPFMFSLFLVAFVIFVAMAWNAGFSFNLFTGEVENDDFAGHSSDSCRNCNFKLIYFALLIVVLIGVAYYAFRYFQANFPVPLGEPAIYPREEVPHHGGAGGAGPEEHSHGSASPRANVRKAK